MFCKHEWGVISKDQSKSHLELAFDAGRGLRGEDAEPLTRRVLVVICACKKCGKLDKTVVEN